jgi:hypothetical protein
MLARPLAVKLKKKSFNFFFEVGGEVDIETPLFNNWAPSSPSASQGECVYITVGVVSNKK